MLFLPSVGAIAIVYGDEYDGNTRRRYVPFFESKEEDYPAQPWFFWSQPLDDFGWVSAHFGSGGLGATRTSTAPTASPGKGKGKGKNGGERGLPGSSLGRLFLGAAPWYRCISFSSYDLLTLKVSGVTMSPPSLFSPPPSLSQTSYTHQTVMPSPRVILAMSNLGPLPYFFCL